MNDGFGTYVIQTLSTQVKLEILKQHHRKISSKNENTLAQKPRHRYEFTHWFHTSLPHKNTCSWEQISSQLALYSQGPMYTKSSISMPLMTSPQLCCSSLTIGHITLESDISAQHAICPQKNEDWAFFQLRLSWTIPLRESPAVAFKNTQPQVGTVAHLAKHLLKSLATWVRSLPGTPLLHVVLWTLPTYRGKCSPPTPVHTRAHKMNTCKNT